MTYTVDYYINKFEAIPEGKWTTGTFNDKIGRSCALGHCGYPACAGSQSEGVQLHDLTYKYIKGNIVSINDDVQGIYNQETPKQRVLAALRDIKEVQEKEETQSAVDQTVEIISQPQLELV